MQLPFTVAQIFAVFARVQHCGLVHILVPDLRLSMDRLAQGLLANDVAGRQHQPRIRSHHL
jgi:hypothetical protein